MISPNCNAVGVFNFYSHQSLFRKSMQTVKRRKQQDDRLLKRMSMKERRQQEELRRLIKGDPIFKTV